MGEFQKIYLEEVNKFFPPLTVDNIEGQWFLHKLHVEESYKDYQKSSYLTNYDATLNATGRIINLPKVLFRLLANMDKIGRFEFQVKKGLKNFDRDESSNLIIFNAWIGHSYLGGRELYYHMFDSEIESIEDCLVV